MTELLMAPEKSELRDWRDITLIHDDDVEYPLSCEVTEEHGRARGAGRELEDCALGLASSSSYK